MIRESDLISIEADDKDILKAASYAEKSLTYTFNRMGKANYYDRARRIVIGVLGELTLQRYLKSRKTKFDLRGATHWTKKDRFDIFVKGKQLDLKTFMPTKGINDFKKLGKKWILDCSAFVPADQLGSRTLKEDDYYVFGIIIGNENKELNLQSSLLPETQRGPKYPIYFFWDYDWNKNDSNISLGKIRVTSDRDVDILLAGSDDGIGSEKNLILEQIKLKADKTYITKSVFHSLLFIRSSKMPSTKIRLEVPDKKLKLNISPSQWGDIWIYDAVVYLCGYLPKGEFKEKSVLRNRFYKGALQYGETKTDNREVIIKSLKPLKDILT